MTANLVTVAVIATTLIGAPLHAADLTGARHRYGVERTLPLGFDRRPALSQREVGSLSLEMLAAGADAALAEEAWNGWAPFCPPPGPGPYGPYRP